MLPIVILAKARFVRNKSSTLLCPLLLANVRLNSGKEAGRQREEI
jgi:hypothetical protein